jgi:hypothetical protein
VEGKAQLASAQDLFDALGKYTPGAHWNGAYYQEPGQGSPEKNQLMVYTDTYVFGKGYLDSTSQKVPASYFSIKP